MNGLLGHMTLMSELEGALIFSETDDVVDFSLLKKGWSL